MRELTVKTAERQTWQPALPPLFELWRLFRTHTDSDKLVQQLVPKLAEAIATDRTSLMLLDKPRRILTIHAAVGLPPDAAGTRLELGQGIAGWVALSGQTLRLPKGPGIPPSLRKLMVREEITSALCVPLDVQRRVIGVLNVARLKGRPPLTPAHLRFVSLLAERTAIGIEVSRLHNDLRTQEEFAGQSLKLVTVGVMAAGIAHELRNPLGIIAAAAEALDGQYDAPALRSEALHKIRSAVQRASLTIENLLRFARPSTEHHRERVDINALMEETLALLVPQTTLQRVTVKMALHAGIPAVEANRGLLQLVFTNIVLNACNAMPQGGALTVTTGAHTGGQVEIHFTDAGHGIPPEHLSKVFDPFFTTMSAGQGTGLGLAISRSIIQQHHGSLEVESELGKGTTFTIRLPCVPPSQ